MRIDELNGDGFSPLHLSVLGNQERAMSLLLRLGARVDIASRDDHVTPLLFAIRMCRLNLIRVLIFAIKLNIKVPTDEPLASDDSALLYTINSFRSAYADKGPMNLDDEGPKGGGKYVAILKYLLECGAKPTTVNSESGTTPLHALAEATEIGQHNIEILVSLLCGSSRSRKMNLNVEDGRHRTPMHIACLRKNHTAMMAFLERGVSCETANAAGVTPVHECARVGDLVGVRMLLDRGASMYRATTDGITPLHCAAHVGNPDIIRVLIASFQQYYRNEMQNHTSSRLPTLQAFLNAPSSKGRTPLHMCCALDPSVAAAKAEECCRVLLSAGADACAIDDDKNTPLHSAAMAGNLAVTQRLLLTPAAVPTSNMKNKNRKYPYQLVPSSAPNGQHLQQILKDAIAIAKRNKHK